MPNAHTGPELPPPTLPNVAQGGVGRHTAAHLLARIGTTAPMMAGDFITLYWGNRFAAAHTLRASELGRHVDLPVPRQLLQSGVQRFHYRLLSPGRCPRRSAQALVTVKLESPGGEAGLPAPTVAAPVLRAGLDLRRLGKGLSVRIAPYRHMAEGDALTLRWGDVRMDLPPLLGRDCHKPVMAWVPRALIVEAGADPRLELSYCVLDRVGNVSAWAPAIHLRVIE